MALAALLLLVGVAPAAAHAVLERADPRPNTSVEETPREAVLSFSEPVDPKFSTATIRDPKGQRVSGAVTLSGDRRVLRIPLTAGARGIYTVRWRVLSVLDGHTTSGAFVFAVGRGEPPPLGSVTTASPAPWMVAVRWVAFLAAMAAAGSLFFQAVILQPVLRRGDESLAGRLRADLGTRLRPVQLAAAVVLLLSVAAEFMLTAAALVDVPLAALRGGVLGPLLLNTKAGWSALTRGAFAVLLLPPPARWGRVARSGGLMLVVGLAGLAALFRGPESLTTSGHGLHLVLIVVVSAGVALVNAVRRPPVVDWVSTLVAAGALAGFTVGSHALASGWIAALADWVHLLAAALWVGGLPALVIALRAPPGLTPALSTALVARFSNTAAVSLGMLAVTGFYGAWLRIPMLRALDTTAYGRTLTLKLLLILPLVALGAVNHFVLRPRLNRSADGGALRGLARVATGEAGLGALILLVVAALTITPPARVALTTARPPLVLAGIAGEVTVRLTITPAQPGVNQYEVEARDAAGTVLPAETRLLLRLKKLDEEITPVTVPLERTQDRYTASDAELGLAGFWEVEVVVRRRGRLDAATAFPLRLGAPPSRPTEAAARDLIARARRATAALRSWRDQEQLTDGRGNVVVAAYELVRPDRLRYRTSAGNEAIIIGTTRYSRGGPSPWERDVLPQPITVEGPRLYMRDADRIILGRRDRCGTETCRVVLWELSDGAAVFAAWIDPAGGRVHRLMMVAANHHMTQRSTDFNAPITIAPPR